VYSGGHVGEPDLAKAADCYRKAAAEGFPRAQVALSRMLRDGIGVSKDTEAAWEWLRKAVEGAGEKVLQLKDYEMPGCSREDRTHALKSLNEAATSRVGEAQIVLGMLYEHGVQVPQDNESALGRYSSALEQGLAEARLLHAELRVSYWYDKYCEVKFARGELILEASREKLGRRAPTNAVEALAWYRKLAEEGNADAQWELFNVYFQGRGVRANGILAFKWLILACQRHPDEEVRAMMEERRRGLEAIRHVDFEKAEHRAAKWRPRLVKVDTKVG